ncbi:MULTISPECIES: hypothetical protein [unclassified Clostridium]|uniref:hypothetical protein n=1 Tax=unclassified Clostridium TaxID=2614128 RepID=UPI000298521E|nr:MULTISPECIES: hypothetical protein [unclassified Clostridium]EKQ55910.1 MAG: hypothetical protein A370_02483 [Clostridium sp. Maddingley MBC34-26]
MDLKPWNEKLKELRSIILKNDKFIEAMNLCLELHAMVHSSEMSNMSTITFEDELWKDLNEETIRTAVNDKGRTIAYGMWHSARIEDITMNILVNNGEQVINSGNWLKKVNSIIKNTGNQLTNEEILEFSKHINIEELKNYRIAVGRKSEEIIKNLQFSDMKRKMEQDGLRRILNEGAVSEDESAIWLIDFWGRKNVSGILLMPLTRHHVVHINESLSAKKKKSK